MRTTESAKTKRFFLRFSVRTLLLLLLAVSVALGSLAWKIERAKRQRDAVAWILNSGGGVRYDYQYDDDGRRVPEGIPTGPKWLRKHLGGDFFDEVIRVEFGSNSNQVTDVTPLARLTKLEELFLDDTHVRDVTPLAALKKLRILQLEGTRVKDVTPLAGLTRLQLLDLRDTQVSQDGYEMLKKALPTCDIYWSATVDES